MKLQRFLVATLLASPSLALAHPGHDATALHVHLGTPGSHNTLEIWLLTSVLLFGAVRQLLHVLRNR